MIGNTQYYCFNDFIADVQLEELFKKSKNLVLLCNTCFSGGALNFVKNEQGLPHNWTNILFEKNPKTTENCLYFAVDLAYSPGWAGSTRLGKGKPM